MPKRATTTTGTVRAGARAWLEIGRAAQLGRGRVELLEAIDAQGSITAAAGALGVSYRAAWRWIDRLNTLGRGPVVHSASGGRRGGGTSLTPWGRSLVQAYRTLEAGLDRALADLQPALDRVLDATPPPAPARKAPPRRR